MQHNHPLSPRLLPTEEIVCDPCFLSPEQLIAAILDALIQRRNDLTGHGPHGSAHSKLTLLEVFRSQVYVEMQYLEDLRECQDEKRCVIRPVARAEVRD